MSAISALKSRGRRKAWAAQNTKESAQHIPQQTNGGEYPQITPHICAKIERCQNVGGKSCGSHQVCYTV
jgi:hypothetical protein